MLVSFRVTIFYVCRLSISSRPGAAGALGEMWRMVRAFRCIYTL